MKKARFGPVNAPKARRYFEEFSLMSDFDNLLVRIGKCHVMPLEESCVQEAVSKFLETYARANVSSNRRIDTRNQFEAMVRATRSRSQALSLSNISLIGGRSTLGKPTDPIQEAALLLRDYEKAVLNRVKPIDPR